MLARLRYEQSLGVNFMARVPLNVAPPAVRPETENRKPETIVSRAVQPETINQTPEEKATRWRVLEAKAMACTQCVLHKGRTNVVFGTGNRSAQLVFVGEGPGADEDQQGLPFVGKSGQLLNKIITAMGMKREEVYICNVVKCRPPENRTPLPDEIAACSPYLFEQLELISPKVIVTLGGPAVKSLLNVTQGIMSIRGKWFAYRGIPVMPTYHPAFVLRVYSEENRRAVWDDMKKVVDKLKSLQS